MSSLIGVSVGTGDSDLITLKGFKAIQSADVIAYIKITDKPSLARTIATPHIISGVEEIEILMPMEIKTDSASNAYDKGALKIKNALNNNKVVIFLCEGDAMFYGSFMYIYDRIKSNYPCQVIPGITSIAAASSSCMLPLVSRNDVLCVVPATLDSERLTMHIKNSDSIAIMKIGRHLAKVKTVLDNLKLTSNSTCIINASCENQQIIPLSDVENAPYFCIILIKKNKELY